MNSALGDPWIPRFLLLSFLRKQESRVFLLANEGQRKPPGSPMSPSVIPAKAGIQSLLSSRTKEKEKALDS